MRIEIPGDVPEEDYDAWCTAFRAGYERLKQDPTGPVYAHSAARELYPAAFDAGVTAAWRARGLGGL